LTDSFGSVLDAQQCAAALSEQEVTMPMTDLDPLDELRIALESRSDVERTKFFGKECLTARGKVIAVLWEGDVVFKLAGKDQARALELDGAHLWDPRGKGHPMREWVQVPTLHEQEYRRLGEAAYEYITSLAGE
jgi:hypothetical protein